MGDCDCDKLDKIIIPFSLLRLGWFWNLKGSWVTSNAASPTPSSRSTPSPSTRSPGGEFSKEKNIFEIQKKKTWIIGIISRRGGWVSSFLRDILSKGRIWESVDQRVLEQQAKREDAIEKLLARQEDTAALVRSLVEQVDLYLMFVFRLDYLYLCIIITG